MARRALARSWSRRRQTTHSTIRWFTPRSEILPNRHSAHRHLGVPFLSDVAGEPPPRAAPSCGSSSATEAAKLREGGTSGLLGRRRRWPTPTRLPISPRRAAKTGDGARRVGRRGREARHRLQRRSRQGIFGSPQWCFAASSSGALTALIAGGGSPGRAEKRARVTSVNPDR